MTSCLITITSILRDYCLGGGGGGAFLDGKTIEPLNIKLVCSELAISLGALASAPLNTTISKNVIGTDNESN